MKKDYKERLIAKAKAEAIGEAAKTILVHLYAKVNNKEIENEQIDVMEVVNIVTKVEKDLGYDYFCIASKKIKSREAKEKNI